MTVLNEKLEELGLIKYYRDFYQTKKVNKYTFLGIKTLLKVNIIMRYKEDINNVMNI